MRELESVSPIVGVEALLRWYHPLHGVIPPGEFILLTEDTGLIISLGEWVLRHSCQQLLQWDDEGLARLHMSVNISPRQIIEPGFVACIQGSGGDGYGPTSIVS